MSMFSEESGKTSSGKTSVFLMALAYIGQASYIVGTTGVIPDIPIQVGFLMAGVYGINKLAPKKEG